MGWQMGVELPQEGDGIVEIRDLTFDGFKGAVPLVTHGKDG